MKRRLRRVLPRKVLRLERLEDRLPLAGNVAADFAGGNLTVTGDDAENGISVFVRDEGGGPELVVQGNNTTVNGGAEAAFAVPAEGINNVTLNLGKAKTSLTRPRDPRGAHGVESVDLGGFEILGNLTISGANGGLVNVRDFSAEGAGNIAFGKGVSLADPLTRIKIGTVIDLDGASFGFSNGEPTPADLSISTNSGNDLISLASSQVGGDMIVTTNAGVDVVTLVQLDIAGNISIDTGAGSDHLLITDLVVEGSTYVSTGAAVDTVNIVSVQRTTTFGGSAKFDLGNGSANELGLLGLLPDGSEEYNSLRVVFEQDLTVRATAGTNVFAAAGVDVGGNLTVATGNGTDVIAAISLNVGGNLSINTGGGVDVVVLGRIPGFTGRNTIGGTTTINTGAGVDVVVIQGTTFNGPVNINLGSGNDVLVMVRNTFNAPAQADGGSGFDTAVFDATFNPFPPNSLRNFSVRTAPGPVNAAMIDFLLSRAFNLLADIFA